jgi:hypothetical protein
VIKLPLQQPLQVTVQQLLHWRQRATGAAAAAAVWGLSRVLAATAAAEISRQC